MNDDRTASLVGGMGEIERGELSAPGGTIGRFLVEGTLGAGGMGVVLAAKDPQLGRSVAIKLLQPTSWDHTARERMLREAQSMAQVQHPNVATVYEVGSLGNQLFVVMELVDGQTLKGWLRERPRSEREIVSMLVAAGRGLEAVHAAGLVHRDFKPDNVLVGRDGRPRVSDFGLVRAEAAAAVPPAESTFSAVGGTPAYMAPEQLVATGADARSDQFSFCVTVYEALSGERPFKADAPAEQRRAPESPPRTFRGSARLFAVLARGLSNRPEDRWPSMSELLAVLGRDRTARRRSIVALAAFGLVAVVLAGGWIRARSSAADRVRGAEALGQHVQQMRSRMRAAHLLPLHDTKPERDRVRSQMHTIEAQMRELGDEGRGPAEFALGVGHFTLGDRKEARKHLEAAWAAGVRSPDLAYDLGLVLGDTYEIEKQNAPPLRTDEERKARADQLNRTLRDPALAYLRQADGAADTSPEYVAAVLARWDRRFDEALQKIDAALAVVPSLYEADLLAADIQAERASKALNAGERERGEALFADMEARFKHALDIGRSDHKVYMRYADWLMTWASYRMRLGGDAMPLLERVLVLCRQGQQAWSDAKWPDEMTGNVGWMLADAAFEHRRDPRPYLKDAIAATGRAQRRDPRSYHAWANLGGANLSQAVDWDLPNGEDASVSLQKSIDAYRMALTIRDDIDGFNNLGLASALLAAWHSAHGNDPTEVVETALTAFDSARRVRPDLHFSATNACDTLLVLARDRFDRGLDLHPTLARADRYCATARTGDAGMPEPFETSARLEGLRAQAAARAGHDPLPAWEQALQAVDKALALNPKSIAANATLAELAARRAEYLATQKRDAHRDLERAKAAADQAVKLGETFADGHRALAFVELVRARGGAVPSAGLAAADRALAIKRDDVPTLLIAAELHLLEARQRAKRGQPTADARAKGLARVERALAINPRSAPVLTVRSELEAIAQR